jgi:hypothetical protein
MPRSDSEPLYVSSADLYDQLMECPDTRFHAAYLFIRYFFLVVGEPGGNAQENVHSSEAGIVKEEVEEMNIIWPNDPKTDEFSNETEKVLAEEGREILTWDLAVGCLAISIKVSYSSLLLIIRPTSLNALRSFIVTSYLLYVPFTP